MFAQGFTRRRLARLRPYVLPVARGAERAVFGGPRRGRLLGRLEVAHMRSVNRHTWAHIGEGEEPPFYDHRIGGVLFALAGENPFGWRRGFHAAELIRPGDAVLDIGCGDGFFASRFFAATAARVDAVDLDQSAIAHARTHNASSKLSFTRLDAVHDPFPDPPYDVVVWDGAVGHFAPEDSARVLSKIAAALAPDGAFVGSESLGTDEGSDHLQWFADLDDLGRMLTPHFPSVEVTARRYPTQDGHLARCEGYWRCALDPGRFAEIAWRPVRPQ